VGMTKQDKKPFKFQGKKLKAIASIFGVEGDPRSYHVHLRLGAKIYGEDNPVIQEAIHALPAKKDE